MTALLVLLVLATTIWVGVDASRRDWSKEPCVRRGTVDWVAGCLLLWIVRLPRLSRQARRRTAQAALVAALPSLPPPVTAGGKDTLPRLPQTAHQPDQSAL